MAKIFLFFRNLAEKVIIDPTTKHLYVSIFKSESSADNGTFGYKEVGSIILYANFLQNC